MTLKKKTLFDYRNKYREGSYFRGKLYKTASRIDGISFQFGGPIADIPCFKNNRQGKHIHIRDRARLQIMDSLFFECFGNALFQLTDPFFLFAQFAVSCKRSDRFDADNAIATLKDWLEPPFKNRRNRGFGVGFIENDNQLEAFGLKKKKDRQDSGTTEVYIVRNDLVAPAIEHFYSEVTNLL